MSQENAEVIRAAFAAYDAGDVAGMLADVDPDLVVERWAPLPDPAVYRGPEGLLQMIADWIEGFDRFQTSAEEYIVAKNDQVITRISQKAVGAESGVPVEAEFWFLWTLEKKRLVRLDLFMTKEQAHEAARRAE